MTIPEPPRKSPEADGRTLTPPKTLPGAPSRALRMRAADGWERFMRRVEAQWDIGT
ncbi:hypothetical protein [Streptomyces sp. NPDC053720]|uniref:hypothetical protein n=1 Tax=Streptomyces sp. NPDC053720 TaxID=3154855 RepID=UPI0034334115